MKLNSQINIVLTNEKLDKGFEKLKNLDFKLSHFPLIKTLPIKLDLNFNISDFNTIIFTSKNGVEYFLKNKLVQKTKLNEIYFVCIGEKTAQKLKEVGFKPGYICKRNYSELMSEELKNKEVLKNKKSLLVQGSLSDNKLIESLKSFSNTEKIISYSTELVNKKYSDLEKITKKDKTYVVFTSPSSFDSFIKFYDASKVNLVSIGNTTSSHITNLGFQTILTSKMQSYEGIIESLITFFNENKQYELSKN